ncbi:MAG: DNA polymerase IV [Chloroflexi bacterium]|nr:DNA polymerase IV [Chloroflexota bacterium]
MPHSRPSVIHVDLDAFFVSMELLRHPELRGQPVIVAGGLGNRGVVSTCSYEARKFGVRSAMPVSQARRLCPAAVYLETDFSWYAPASRKFHAILRDYTPVVEPAGADEAYLDVAGSERLFGDAPAIAAAIRQRVRDEIGITASAGVSINKLVSKVASDAGKPDGLVVVPAGEEAAFFAPRPIRELPMVGPKTAATLATLGIKTIGDIARMPPAALVARFGSHGAELAARARGVFDAPVLSGHAAAKSVSREMTFDADEPSRDRLRAVLRGQAERVAADLAHQGRSARTVTLKLRFPPFETLTRSWTGPTSVDLADDLFEAGANLFERAWEEHGRRPVRLLGLGAANLQERARQLRLGDTGDTDRLAEAVADLRARFGEASVQRAAELGQHVARADVPAFRPFAAPEPADDDVPERTTPQVRAT